MAWQGLDESKSFFESISRSYLVGGPDAGNSLPSGGSALRRADNKGGIPDWRQTAI